MAQLTKQYLDEQFEKQALLINRAFQAQKDHFDKRLDELDRRIAALEKKIMALEARMTRLENEMKALSSKVTNYLQLSDKRYLELKRRDMVIAKWLKQVADKTGVEIDLAELEKF